jgi:hypothetical protein
MGEIILGALTVSFGFTCGYLIRDTRPRSERRPMFKNPFTTDQAKIINMADPMEVFDTQNSEAGII